MGLGQSKKPPAKKKEDRFDLNNDKDFSKLRLDEAKRLWKVVIPILEKIVTAPEACPHCGEMLDFGNALAKVKASDQIRRWTYDKEVAERRDLGRDRVQDTVDHAQAVADAERRIRKAREAKAEKAGKLKRLAPASK